jgi:hypothetical protein
MELTLKKTQSALFNLSLVESIDTSILDKLITSDLLQKDAWINPQTGEKVNYSNEKEHLLALRKKVKSGKLTVTYKATKLNFGRVYPVRSLSLGSIRREIRHTLAKDVYVDVDINNAHPVFLLQLCEENEIDCEYLQKYVRNRDKYLKQVIDTYGVDRDAAKQLFIRLLYFGNFDSWKDDHNIDSEEELPFVHRFSKELKYIGKDIVSANPKLLKQITKTNKKNATATLVSIVLQEHERRCLEAVYNHLRLKKCIINNAVLCFDGIMIPKDQYKPSLLKELAEAVKDDTGFNVTFSTKDMDQDYLKELEKVVDVNSFEYQARIFEETHCKIVSKGLYVKQENNRITYFSPQQLIASYEHMTCVVDGQEASFIKKWMTKNPNIRKYDDMDVFPPPLKVPDNVFNVWTPFEAAQMGDIEPNEEGLQFFLDHLKIISNHNEEHYRHFCRWIAQMIQFPAIKTICVVMIGKKGDGKSSVVRGIRKMLGDSKVLETTTPSRDVWGNFNNLMMDCYLVNPNELSKRDFIEGESQFKALVTDYDMTINSKGTKAFRAKSYHRVIIGSNSETPIKVTDDERRTFLLRASDEKIGDKKYFDKLYSYLDDQGTISAMYQYFSTMKGVAEFHKELAPVSDHQKELAKLDRSPIEQFVMDLVENKNDGVMSYTNKTLYNKFRDFIDENDIEYKCSNVKFGVNLTLAKIDGVSNETKRNTRMKSFDIKTIRKHFKMDPNPFKKQKRVLEEDSDSDSDSD